MGHPAMAVADRSGRGVMPALADADARRSLAGHVRAARHVEAEAVGCLERASAELG
jgi:hypothetical protein